MGTNKTPSDRLDGVAVFVQAAEAGSFAEAAARLRLTRSAVGKAIAKLEQRLGTRLFHRTTRSLTLTEDGQAYYERCARALTELEAAEAELERGQHEPRGHLRVSAPVLFGRRCVAPVLRALVLRHPQLRLDMTFSDRRVDLLEEGIDLAVRVGPLPDSSSLAARGLGLQHMGIAAAPAYLDAHGRPTTLEALDGHRGIVRHHNGVDVPWAVLDDEGRPHHPKLDLRMRLDDLQAIADAALAGAGLAWLPCWLLAPHVRAGELEWVLGDRRSRPMAIHLVWPHTRYLPSKTRAAIDALAEAIPPLLAAPLDA